MYLIAFRAIPGALPERSNYSRSGWAVEAESIGTTEPAEDAEAAIRLVQGWVSGGPCPDGFVTGSMLVECSNVFEITKTWGDRGLAMDGATYYVNGRRARGQNAARSVYDAAGPEATVRQEATDSYTGCGSSTRECGEPVLARARLAGIGAIP